MLNKLRQILTEKKLDALLINSTNEFLVEYNALEENSRYKLTGFSGSTGDAVVTANEVYLFVDGRYHIQADNEVDRNIVTVIKLQTGETMIGKLQELLPKNCKLGMMSKKNSLSRFEEYSKFFNINLINLDPFDEETDLKNENIEKISDNLCGLTVEDKLENLRKHLGNTDAFLITSLEEVSYIFNLRDFSVPYSSKVLRRAIITKTSSKLYAKNDFEEYKKDLQNIKGKIFVDKKSINMRDYELIEDKAVQKYCDNNYKISISSGLKSSKTNAEIEHYKDAFSKTDKTVKAIRQYIEENDNISEYDIDKKLEEYFLDFGAKSLSFKSIVAKDKNSALAHYSKSSKDEIIKDGSLILIDCGAYYEGGLATDITRVFVKGEPTELQKTVYTTVLRAFLRAFNTKIEAGITSGFDIDNKTREFFKDNNINGFEFNHGLGHGIGVSVHEYPPSLSCSEMAKVPIHNNMCFTIEPGLYNKDLFGVRLENSCYLENGQIKSFVKMNYENKLINYDLMTEQEKIWLKDFEVI